MDLVLHFFWRSISVPCYREFPPLVELLEFPDLKVQRAVAGALRTLSFENYENKNQIVECNALPALTLLLCSEDVTIQKEADNVVNFITAGGVQKLEGGEFLN
ncbi:hypothetical protein ACET3Z_012719 [Daucus carota]